MLRTLLRLQLLAFRRAPFLGGRIALAVMQALGMAYAVFCAGAIGFLLPEILSVAAPDASAVRIVDLALLPALAALTAGRLIFQDLPTRGAHAFLLLPVPRRRVATAVLARSAATALNLLPLVFAVPFALRSVRAADGWGGALVFLAGVTTLVAISHLALVIWKTRLGEHLIATVAGLAALFAAIAGLEVATGGLVLTLRTNGVILLALLGVLVGILGTVAFHGMTEALYLDRSTGRKRRKRSASGFARQGTRAFVDLDMRLLLRTSFPRSTAANAAVVSLALSGVVLLVADPATTALVLIFSTGTVAGSLGQFTLPFASGHYDRLLTLPGGLASFVRARLLILGASTLVLAVLQLALVLALDAAVWPLILASTLFSAGILAPVALLGSTIAPKPLDVSEGVAFNYKVQSFAAQVAIMSTASIVGLAFLAFGPTNGAVATGFAGALGVLAFPLWVRAITARIEHQRHSVAARFRAAL